VKPAKAAPESPRLIRPLLDFLRTESAGGVVLVAATVVALLWANSPWKAGYAELWSTDLAISLGDHTLSLTLRGWINEGLMTLFFFVVGLEIKRELVEGELRDPRRAALPAIAAVGGMVVPALIYFAFTAGTEAEGGWGIPTATDIAIALGVLGLLGARVNPSLKLFLLALAIVDDIGAILVIAIVYSDGLDFDALLISLVFFGVIVGCRAGGVRYMSLYVVLGAAAWIALHEAGVHATLVGVACGLLAPTRPIRQREYVDVDALTDISTPETARETATLARESVSIVEWLEQLLHPWTSFVIVPLFALANAGIPLAGKAIGDAFGSRVTYGVLVGLVVGKLVGISLFSWLAVRTGAGALPEDTSWSQIIGVAALGGIGFTVAIFVAGLAFDDPTLLDESKIGILVASVVAGIVGALLLTRTGRSARSGDDAPG
jgi:Na+:H+ antiporter, NhaA family